MARNIWQLKFDGREYVFDPQMLTVGRLRQIKSWYPEIGRYTGFILALSQGDPEAALCALWIARHEAGESNVPDPEKMPDFSLSDFFAGVEVADDETEADPTEPGTEPQTPVSTGTPTNSAPDTSDS